MFVSRKILRLNSIIFVQGGARYVPGAADDRPTLGADPFTGTCYFFLIDIIYFKRAHLARLQNEVRKSIAYLQVV